MEKRNIREQFQKQVEKWVEQDKESIISFFQGLFSVKHQVTLAIPVVHLL